MLRLDVRNSRELQAVLLAIRAAPANIRKDIRQQTKEMALPAWSKGLAEHADTRLQHVVLVDTAKVTASDNNVRLSSAGSARKLSGGLKPSQQGGGVEFGADRNKVSTYQRKSKHGGTHKVTRHASRAFGPIRAKGKVVYPTAAALVPRFAALWVQTTVRVLHNAFEGK